MYFSNICGIFPVKRRKHLIVAAILLQSIVISCTDSNREPSREEILFNMDWKFMRNDVPGAEAIAFDDASWRSLDLPHDYSIEDLPGTASPFSCEAVVAIHGGYTTGGTAWYRKTFEAPAAWKGKTLEILFEGVHMNADVWVNGKHVGNHIYGYTPFHFDITGEVQVGKKNIIAVQVKNEGVNSRWYTGSGIYRHVWLKVLDPVHIVENGVFITTPDVDQDKALISIQTSVTNKSAVDQPVRVITEILAPDGSIAGTSESKQSVKSGDSSIFNQQIHIAKPLLWSPDAPTLYSARTKVISKNMGDVKNTTFGIRTVTIDLENGFVLNGVPMKLKGACIHHDNGLLGSRSFDRAEERKVELLKASGFNAVRCAHNPHSVAFLNACDRLGLLVIDEALDVWQWRKNPQDYHLYFKDDWKNVFRAMVERSRNHPSIFLWSLGNEIQRMDAPETVAFSKELGNFVRSLDATRPITAGVNGLTNERKAFFSTLDVSGVNYAILGNRDFHPMLAEKNPGMIMYGSESYALDAFDAWAAVEKYPYLIGDFVWTGIDYIGESSIGWHGYPQKKELFYPWTIAHCGDIDICGWKRPQSYYRDAFWNKDNITIAVQSPVPSFEPPQSDRETWSRWHFDDVVFDWNWAGREGKPITVDVYSSANEVELFLNGKSLGRKKAGREYKNKASYFVPYERGELKAIGYIENGKTIENTLRSSEAASMIKLTPDRTGIKSGGQDISYVTVELVDQNGILDPKAENQLDFFIAGDASIIAIGNANPVSVESYTQPTRKAWRGKCMVVVKSGQIAGDVTLTVKSAGLKEADVKLSVIP